MPTHQCRSVVTRRNAAGSPTWSFFWPPCSSVDCFGFCRMSSITSWTLAHSNAAVGACPAAIGWSRQVGWRESGGKIGEREMIILWCTCMKGSSQRSIRHTNRISSQSLQILGAPTRAPTPTSATRGHLSCRARPTPTATRTTTTTAATSTRPRTRSGTAPWSGRRCGRPC